MLKLPTHSGFHDLFLKQQSTFNDNRTQHDFEAYA